MKKIPARIPPFLLATVLFFGDITLAFFLYKDMMDFEVALRMLSLAAQSSGSAIDTTNTDMMGALFTFYRRTLLISLGLALALHLVIYSFLGFKRPWARRYVLFYSLSLSLYFCYSAFTPAPWPTHFLLAGASLGYGGLFWWAKKLSS